MKTTFIYALKELAPGEFQSSTIRYVGKANDPYKRFEEHLGSRRSTHLGNWIRGLSARGYSLQLEVLDEIPESQWQFWEREYIRVFRAIGFNLVNGTAGGDGLVDPAGETREKISRALLGNKNCQGEKRSIETRARMSQTRRSNNSSGVAGVSWNKEKQKWAAYIGRPGGKRIRLGYFDLLEKAAQARRSAFQQHYGA